MTKAASVADEEVARFSAQADAWWDPEGAFRSLHQLNPLRVEYVRDRVCEHFERAVGRDALRGLAVLDVGCGGGLLAEPLARLGAKVTGLDASEATVAVAREHARQSQLTIDYRAGSVEALAASGAAFDVIVALEILEHVADVDSFVAALAKLLKPGGVLVMATLNRTTRSYVLGIVMAEYVLRWVPPGTHDWDKFVRPSELVRILEHHGLRTEDLTGMVFNPLRGAFQLKPHRLGVNYFVTAVRTSRSDEK